MKSGLLNIPGLDRSDSRPPAVLPFLFLFCSVASGEYMVRNPSWWGGSRLRGLMAQLLEASLSWYPSFYEDSLVCSVFCAYCTTLCWTAILH